MRRSKDDEDIERERAAREWECVLTWMHAYKHLVMIPDDRNFPKESRMTISPCQRAPPQEDRNTEVAAQAPLPPDEHKAVRWEGGEWQAQKHQEQGSGRNREKRRCCGECGCPPWRESRCCSSPATNCSDKRANFYLPNATSLMAGCRRWCGGDGECVSMRQSDMPSAFYLSANLEQWYPHFCLNFSTPGKAIVFNVCLNEVDPVCWNGRGGPRRTFPEVVWNTWNNHPKTTVIFFSGVGLDHPASRFPLDGPLRAQERVGPNRGSLLHGTAGGFNPGQFHRDLDRFRMHIT